MCMTIALHCRLGWMIGAIPGTISCRSSRIIEFYNVLGRTVAQLRRETVREAADFVTLETEVNRLAAAVNMLD